MLRALKCAPLPDLSLPAPRGQPKHYTITFPICQQFLPLFWIFPLIFFPSATQPLSPPPHLSHTPFFPHPSIPSSALHPHTCTFFPHLSLSPLPSPQPHSFLPSAFFPPCLLPHTSLPYIYTLIMPSVFKTLDLLKNIHYNITRQSGDCAICEESPGTTEQSAG